MPRKSLIAIISIVLFSFLVVILLYISSDEPLKYSQSFIRTFEGVHVTKKNVLDLQDNSYYIAGATNNEIFLGNSKDSLDLLVTDTSLKVPKHIRLSVANQGVMLLKAAQPGQLGAAVEKSLKLKGSYIEIDSPFFYIKAGDLPGIFRGVIGQWHATRTAKDIPFFSNAIPLTKNSFAFMAIGAAEGSNENQNILCTISSDNPVKFNPDILEAQVDALFSTRGVLRYSKQLNQLVYTYDYRNEFLVIDTSLNLLSKANTIDLVSQAHVKPVEVDNGTYSLASTPAIVNKNAQVYGSFLFIHSNLMASNETREAFDSVSVIDVYDIKTKLYQLSFHLPDFNNSKMSSFKIVQNKIIALYDHNLVVYSIEWSVLNNESI